MHTGETANINVTVRPLEGTGSLEISLDWNAAEIDKPSILAELIPPAGDPLSLTFQLTGADAGTHSSGNIPTGYYALVLQLKDNNLLTMGAVEVIRIIVGQTTKGVFHFSKLNRPGGNLIVNITPEMQEPIPVTISGQKGTILTKDSLKLSAVVPAATGNTICIWHCNGEPVATGSSWTIQNLAVGTYRIDATVFSADVTRDGSSSCMLQVVESLPRAILTIESSDTNGVVSPAGSQEIPLNQDIAISASAKRDWVYFERWEVVSGEGVEIEDNDIYYPRITVRLTKGAGTIRAVFRNVGFEVDIILECNGIHSLSPYIFHEPKSIQLNGWTEESSNGYVFKHWYCSGQITIDDPNAINTIAHINGPGQIIQDLEYHQQSMLSIEDYGPGDSIASFSYYKYPDTRYEVKAIPYFGGRFKEWIAVRGNPDIENPQSATTGIVLTQDAVIRAVFESLEISLNIVNSGSAPGHTEPSGIITVHYRDTLSIKAIPAAGSKFVHWIITDPVPGLTIEDHYASETTITVLPEEKLEQIYEINAIFEYEQ